VIDLVPALWSCSAFRDRRFSPINATEIPYLKCSVSLLVNYEPAKDAWDWEASHLSRVLSLTCHLGPYRR
jgi:AMME syndrome candidate gene 1 protein